MANKNKRGLFLVSSGAVAKSSERTAREFFDEGIVAEANGSYNFASHCYREALRLDPKMAAALVNLGTVYDKRRDLLAAKECFGRALDIDPDYPLALFNMGCCIEKMGETDEAERWYRKAIRVKADYADAHYNLANVLEVVNPRDAIAHYKLYLKYGFGDAEFWRRTANARIKVLQAKDLRVISKDTVVQGTDGDIHGSKLG